MPLNLTTDQPAALPLEVQLLLERLSLTRGGADGAIVLLAAGRDCVERAEARLAELLANEAEVLGRLQALAPEVAAAVAAGSPPPREFTDLLSHEKRWLHDQAHSTLSDLVRRALSARHRTPPDELPSIAAMLRAAPAEPS